MQRETMQFDVLIIGAGPAGLSAACRVLQRAKANQQDISVCIVEKSAEVGGHILSGAVFDPIALNELFPQWQAQGAPLTTQVTEEEIHFLTSNKRSFKVPGLLYPKPMHNKGNYIVSMGNVCRWLAEQAESLGAEIFPGFAATEVLYNEAGAVKGVITGDMGLSKTEEYKPGYQAGIALEAKFTLFAEGCRGSLGKQLNQRYGLDKKADPQKYGLGLKEIWQVDAAVHQAGKVVHTAGWPLTQGASGGSFLYHIEQNQVVVGLIVDLNYSNPHVSPFDEFQRLKHHPVFKQTLQGGKRLCYGARAISKGGWQAIPQLIFPGGALIGCEAGFVNFAKIKGNHTAMKSGMLAADAVVDALAQASDKDQATDKGITLKAYESAFKQSWIEKELYQSRNFGPALHKFGIFFGAIFNYIEQNIFGGKLPLTLHDKTPDHATLKPANTCPHISYPKPDGKISFDKMSSVFISNTNHEEDQPCHLHLSDPNIPIKYNLPKFDEPAQRYCPAGVYEVVRQEEGQYEFRINGQNCVHCKTCDIKDPSQNINWVPPEGGGGPNYPNM